MARYDAIVIGARCAGAALANLLARAGASVLMIDRDPPGTDTLSTHYLFPNGVARLEQLGALERLDGRHRLNFTLHQIAGPGARATGRWTPVGEHELGLGVRRLALDRALAEAAMDAGAEGRFGDRVVGLIGRGSADDPVTGVVLEGDERLEAEWTFGADGRASIVARTLGLEKRDPRRGDISILFGYWRGLPPREVNLIHARPDLILGWIPCEDDVHLLNVSGPPGFTRGSPAEKHGRLMEALAGFSDEIDPAALERAELVDGRVLAAPETMLRGYFRRAAGPGWALVGDSGHFKHPATAQGIADAFEQAFFVAGEIERGGDLSGYGAWRDERAADHYEFSFLFAQPPQSGTFFRWLAADDEAAQDLRDVFTRRIEPSAVVNRERMAGFLERNPATA